jgi:hypothetical protein
LVFEHGRPQQSVSARQSSPVGWQPEGVWQTLKPLSPPVAPHAREQHDWSHTTPEHRVPDTLHWPAPLPPGAPQVPFALLPVLTHWPLQHWPFWKQISPSCAQYETCAEQTPLLQ